MRIVLDTNTLIYKLKSRLADELPDHDIVLSIISHTELFSDPGMTPAEADGVKRLLNQLDVVPLTDEIAERTILLRQPSVLSFQTPSLQQREGTRGRVMDQRSAACPG